jgi:acyl-CoA synthetase (AMP-forming)/AMP-acid ligase II
MAVSTALYGVLAGVPACCLPRFDVQAVVEAIRRHRISTVIGVPAMFIRLVEAEPDPEALASVRLWVSAGDYLPAPIRERLLQYGGLVRRLGLPRIGPLYVNAYGMVEIGGVALCGIGAPFLPGGGEFCLPVPPFKVRVVGEHGRQARPDETGECQIRGPGVTGKYWGGSEGTQGASLDGGWLRTGDLASRNRLGLIRLNGRAKDVIKCRGYSVFAEEVEQVLAAHPAVLRAVVIGIPHPDMGEAPLGIVECHPGPAPSAETLDQWCRRRLAAYKVPRAFRIAEANSLPSGVTEKILNRVLRAQYSGEFVAGFGKETAG